ncbi:hypothetical protein HanRHA438_Chr15g0683301 [Helianthus annuus]|nr:hypothetical protein HanRHA438_Chr15g0683301 [Helianthus annuus]
MVPLRLFDDNKRTLSILSSKNDLGISPSSLLKLKSSVSNEDNDGLVKLSSTPAKLLLESSICCTFCKENKDEGILPSKSLNPKSTETRF